MELLTHGGEHHEIGDGGRLTMTMGTDSPLWSPEQTPDPRTRIYGVGVEVGGASGAHEAGGHAQGVGAPPPSWTGCGPPDVDSSDSIFIYSKNDLH